MNTNTSIITEPEGAVAMTDLAAIQASEGDHRFFLNHLGTVKVEAGDAESGLGVVEFRAPRGFATPVHAHDEQDEILFLIDGELRLGEGDDSAIVGSGALVTLPRGVPHVFQVLSDEAHFLSITAGRSIRPTFEQFVVAMSHETEPGSLPEPEEIDPARVAQVGAAHGIQVLGPPPAPLD